MPSNQLFLLEEFIWSAFVKWLDAPAPRASEKRFKKVEFFSDRREPKFDVAVIAISGW